MVINFFQITQYLHYPFPSPFSFSSRPVWTESAGLAGQPALLASERLSQIRGLTSSWMLLACLTAALCASCLCGNGVPPQLLSHPSTSGLHWVPVTVLALLLLSPSPFRLRGDKASTAAGHWMLCHPLFAPLALNTSVSRHFMKELGGTSVSSRTLTVCAFS